MKDIEILFPVIADIKMDVAKKYGMVHASSDDTHAVRAVFYIDPKGIIRSLMYYPASAGRNFQEIMRLLIALQTADEDSIATPADWQPGEDVIIPPPGSCGMAKDRMDQQGDDYYCLDWFLCFKKLKEKKKRKKK